MQNTNSIVKLLINMKNFLSFTCLLSCCLLVAGALVSCDSPYEQKEAKFSKAMDLNADRYLLGLPHGAKAMHVGEKVFTQARHSYYANNHAAYRALLQGEIDGYLYDSHAVDYLAAGSPDLAVLPDPVGKVDIAIGIAPKNADLLPAINAFIDQYKKDGTYEAMYERWVSHPEARSVLGYEKLEVPQMPHIATPEEPTRTLVVGTSREVEPMCFASTASATTDELTGFDMELLRRLALHLNAKVEIREMNYVAMIDQLSANKIDIVIAGLNRTEEREKRNIIFSKNYINSNIVMLVRSDQVAEESK